MTIAMINFRSLLACLLLTLSYSALADPNERQMIELEAQAFMERYLNVYNRRFGHPERGEQFRKELGELVGMPLLVSPPTSTPRVPPSREAFTKSFEAFVRMLDTKQVARLEWERLNLQVLTRNKVLANNIGHGYNEAGELVYETVSLYLLYRDDSEGEWKIVLFSPYDIENA